MPVADNQKQTDALAPHTAAGGQMTPRSLLGAAALFLAGFALAALLLHGVILAAVKSPLNLHADVRSEKLAMLAGWHGRYFSAAFGSSHIHNGFDARVFDRTMATTPEPTHSVNLAIEGGSQSEQRAMALAFEHQLMAPAAAGAPPQPCLVLLEITAGTNFTNDHLVHPRAINIYDWPTATLMTRFTDSSMSLTQRLGRPGFALAAMALHYANVGMLSNLVFAPPLNDHTLHVGLDDDRRGQMAETYQPPSLTRIDKFLAERPAQPEHVPANLTPGTSELAHQLFAASPVRGLSVVYFVLPMIDDVKRITDYPDHLAVDGRAVPILNLGRPDLYPQLYHSDLWHDPAHLDERGAELASALLATQLARWYQAHGAPPACGQS